MKKNKTSLIFIILILFNLTSMTTYCEEDINNNTPLSWYYVQRGEMTEPYVPSISKDFLQKNDVYYIGNNKKKELYLTFDEGYEKGNTAAILDTLKKLDVPAAFFVVKGFIDAQPELIRRMENEGHLVCNHSSTHPSMPSINDTNAFNKEFTDVEIAYKKVTGKDLPKYFRPPMGKYSKESLSRTKALGYKTIFWSFAYQDWLINNQPTHESAIKRIKNGIHPGTIILLHAVSDTNRDILEEIILDFQKEGYIFKSLDSLSNNNLDLTESLIG